MEKLDGTSMNLVQENIKKLKEIFPEIFIEGRIDFDLLRQICHGGGVQDLENSKERYSLTWNGKSEARQIAQEVSTGTLRPAKEESKNWDSTENIYIEGDNLEVLKLLQKSYHGKIKMIYIDPPYNTGKDFVYKDNFKDNIENYKKLTGQINEEGIKLTTNTETNGRYHSDWLNMMYPRLKLARNLLTDDGVIFISIDDNEQENLKKICDEIFGEENFVAQIAWRKSDNQANIGNIARVKEYILSYSKNDKLFYLNKMELTEKAKKEYRYKDDRGFFRRSILLHKTRGRYKYDLKTPTGKILSGPWMKSKEDIEKMSNEGMIYWTTGGEEQPYGKIYLDESDGQIPNDFIGIEYGSNQEASLELEKLMQSRYFDFPKSVTLLKHLAKIGSNLDNYILDFFSGSATTAHSVIQLNAEDGGNRKYIMVQLPELCDEDSEAYKAGYKNICEIGKERIRRAGEKIKSDESLPLENREKLDIGFKVFKLDSSNIKEWDTNTEDLQQTLLDSMENIKSDRNSLDVLYEILLKYGLDLNIPIEENKNFYSIGGGSLLVSLDKEINDEVINSICEEYKKLLEIDKDFKTTVTLRDNSFKDDVDKTNAIKKLEQVGINEIRSI
ncbi:site-specific DNA-methyltransferase [Fusobacterium polymorphum]|uniref:Site-specific DNA-methyltransferase n=1 Tax=Fusobacterium nucleatum subsp. polymorphum TaxID=76857 RepID=A0A246EIR6_FUSNP|nr:site-specific DNA-methyltransferase [Fusobacterium polymorphum]OWP26517.1 site-specific DNA-methyltransferase [Fusobacterium polymorphum]